MVSKSSLVILVLATLACKKPPEQAPSEQPGQAQPGATCDFEADPNKKYVGQSPEACATMRFMCEQSYEYFADDCGCGCVLTSGG